MCLCSAAATMAPVQELLHEGVQAQCPTLDKTLATNHVALPSRLFAPRLGSGAHLQEVHCLQRAGGVQRWAQTTKPMRGGGLPGCACGCIKSPGGAGMGNSMHLCMRVRSDTPLSPALQLWSRAQALPYSPHH